MAYSSNFRALNDDNPDLELRRAMGLLEGNPVVSLRKSGIRDEFIRERYVVRPMAALPELILKRAAELGAESGSTLETLCGTKVTGFTRTEEAGWELRSEGGELVESYDWVVSTSAPPASGGGALRQIAEASGDAALSARVETIADGLTIESAYVAMLAWEVPPHPSESNPDPPKADAALSAALRSLVSTHATRRCV